MSLRIKLAEWKNLNDKVQAVMKALDELHDTASEMACRRDFKSPEATLLYMLSDAAWDKNFQEWILQSEWLGDNSGDPNNFGLREPNAVGRVGNIPHLIEGSRGH